MAAVDVTKLSSKGQVVILFRMKQFYEAYRNRLIVSSAMRQLPGCEKVAPAVRQLPEKVSPLLTQLPWTHHLLIVL